MNKMRICEVAGWGVRGVVTNSRPLELQKMVIGVAWKTDVSLSEAEVHWRPILTSLSERGHHGLNRLVGDNHNGLKAVQKKVFSSIPWQRC